MHVPSATGGSNADGRPTADLSLRELFDLNAYWLAINILWGALGISLLPILIVDTRLRRRPVCGNPTPILGGIVAVGKGTAEAIIVDARRHRRDPRPADRGGDQRPHLDAGSGGASRSSSSARSSTWSSCSASTSPGAWIGLLVFYCPAPVQLELRAGAVPGLHARPRPGHAGRPGERADGPDDPARRSAAGRSSSRSRSALGNAARRRLPDHGRRAGDDAADRDPRPRRAAGHPARGRSWRRIAPEAWGTDILRERSFLWLLGSRLFLLMADTTLIAMAFFFMQDTFALERQEAVNLTAVAGDPGHRLRRASRRVPSGRLSERIGRKRMIYGSARRSGSIGMAGIAIAPIDRRRRSRSSSSSASRRASSWRSTGR